jgi:hypothetical protein
MVSKVVPGASRTKLVNFGTGTGTTGTGWDTTTICRDITVVISKRKKEKNSSLPTEPVSDI